MYTVGGMCRSASVRGFCRVSLHLLCAYVRIRELAAGSVGVSSAHRHWCVRLHVPMRTEGFVSIALCV